MRLNEQLLKVRGKSWYIKFGQARRGGAIFSDRIGSS